MKIFNAENTKVVDRLTIAKQQITSIELMEKAALQAFLWLVNHFHDKKTIYHIFCGVGNNGGDGDGHCKLFVGGDKSRDDERLSSWL